jgi:hypothetical protein
MAAWLLLNFALPSAFAADYVLIANKSLYGTAITVTDVKQIFLGVKTRLAGKNVEPVLARGGSVHREFAADYLGKTEAGLYNYFRMLIFAGKGSMPTSFATTGEIVGYVSKTTGAVGYVTRNTDLSSVVVLEPR